MSPRHVTAPDHRKTADLWYVRVNRKPYGPIDTARLQAWAARGRIGPGNLLSADGKTWSPVETHPDLQMTWRVAGEGDAGYGPFNLLATPWLVAAGIVSPHGTLENLHTGKTVSVETIVKQERAGMREAAGSPAEAADDAPVTLPASERWTGDVEDAEEATWYLRTDPAHTYGPLTLSVLCDWAEKGCILGTHRVSRDGDTWLALESLPALKIEWTALLPNNRTFGPFNILGAPRLLDSGVFTPETVLHNPLTGKRVLVGDWVKSEHAGGPVPAASRKRWSVRDPHGSVTGPFALTELCGLAAECRLDPAAELSNDGQNWTPAGNVPEIGMEWIVTRRDGKTAGPLSVFGVHYLIGKRKLAAGSPAWNQRTGKTLPAGTLLRERPTLSVADRVRALQADPG